MRLWAFLILLLFQAKLRSDDKSSMIALARSCQESGELQSVFQKLTHIPALNTKKNSPWRIKEAMDIRGSGRRFYRVTRRENQQVKSYIIMRFNDSRADNLNFVKATEFLKSQGVRVPQIYAHEKLDASEEFLLLEDFGDDLLKKRVEASPLNIESDYKAVLREAGKMHQLKESQLINAPLEPPFEAKYYLWEQDLFREKLLEKTFGLSSDETRKILPPDEQDAFIKKIASYPKFLVHRDFQSENIMFPTPKSPGFIDYQGMRLGRPEYDVASLIYDPYVNIPPKIQETLLNDAYLRFNKIGVIPKNLDFETWKREYFAPAAIQRLMQALGAYGRLSTEAGRTEYAQYIPIAKERLLEVLKMAQAFKSLQEYLIQRK